MAAKISFGILKKGDAVIGFSEGTFLIKSPDARFRLVFTDLDDEGLPRVMGSADVPEFKTNAKVKQASMLSPSMAMFQFDDGTANITEFSESNFDHRSTTNVIIGDNDISVDDGDVKISTF